MITLEQFGFDCGGAVRCVYDGGRDDWMVLPFRDDRCKDVRVVGEDRFVAVGSRSLALFDTEQRACLGRRPLSGSMRLTVASGGDHIVVLGRIGEEIDGLAIYSGFDLGEILRVEDKSLSQVSPLYERYDGTLISGGVREGPRYFTYVVSFEDGGAVARELDGKAVPRLFFRKSWLDPKRRRVATLSGEFIPMETDGGTTTYGITMDIWDLEALEIENSIVVDRLAPELHHKYWGQDRRPAGDLSRLEWRGYVETIDPAKWSGSLRRDLSQLDKETQDRESKAGLVGIEFLRENLVDLAWEPGGEALWALFFSGILRRVGVDGSLSPRYVIERFATPPALGRRRWGEFGPWARQLPRTLACLTDGRLRVEGRVPGQANGAVHFHPSEVTARSKGLRGLLSGALGGGAPGGFVVDQRHDGYIPSTQGAEAPRDAALEARKREFERQAIEAEVPLASLSGPDCVAAIDWLAEAVGTRFTELVCGYWFRPVFALPSSSGNGSGRQERLDEEDFFAYVADKVSEAAPSLERLVEVFLAEAPKIPLQLVSQLYGPDEETPAMAHAVKALIALDPTRYAVLRRYISAIDVEHDSFVKTTLARFFGQSNGWRDVEAVRLGIVWMLEQWCGGWGGYGSLWTDFGMADEVKRRFTSDDFARLFLQEAQVFFSPSDEDGSINRAAWNDNSAANFLSESRARLFGDPGAFNEGVLSEIDRALAHKPN